MRLFLLSVCVVDNVFFDFLEQVGGKHEVTQRLVGRFIYKLLIANPLTVTLVDKHDVLAYSKHRVHIMGVDYGSYLIFMRYVAQQFIYKNRCFGSSPELGSSQKRYLGLSAIARAMATRFCIPPEISLGYLSSAPLRPTRSRQN